ncbi:uncharacterized protein G2W53_005771 [Senna tora]|uniref:Uncharacterized protein n=1 Tax=Senna tora TaxID=362788 RepID=A0A834X3N3_9FABA|nr:uncharacterized protein G2W53_005771 [Senna tora]
MKLGVRSLDHWFNCTYVEIIGSEVRLNQLASDIYTPAGAVTLDHSST